MIREEKNGVLYFDGCNTVDLAKKYGTPLYVISETFISAKCAEIRDNFLTKYERTRAAYAGKAFLTLAMCKVIEKEGLCIDVVSGGELYTAVKADFPSEKIELNGNNKSVEEIEMAVDYNIGRIIIDGLDELSIIENVCRIKNKKINVLYRITPGVKSDSHDYIVTGKKDSKFGIPLDDEIIFPAVERAVKSEYVNFMGFQFHIGSQLNDNEPYLKALEVTLKIMKDVIDKYGCVIPEINVGGGFGISYADGDIRRPYSYFLDPIMERIERFAEALNIERPIVAIEPGRSIVGEGGITLYSVGAVKEIPGIRKYVSVDGGMTDNIRPALYQAKYEAVAANKANEEKTDIVTICGKCCESGDVLIRDAHVASLERGDILAVFSTGAYGYSMASNYNKNTIPAVVMVKDGESRLIVRRQTYEDMIKNEIM